MLDDGIEFLGNPGIEITGLGLRFYAREYDRCLKGNIGECVGRVWQSL